MRDLADVVPVGRTRQNPGSTATDRSVAGESEERIEEPSESVVFSILKNTRRRHVLRYVAREDRTVSLAELAVYIASRENDVSPELVTSAQRKRVYVALYQTHMPKLDDAGAVDYDSARKYASPAPGLGAFRPYLEDDPTWSHWYFSLGVLAVGAAVVVTLEAGSATIPYTPVALGLATLFLGTTLWHAYAQLSPR
jgi:hypothetical protein